MLRISDLAQALNGKAVPNSLFVDRKGANLRNAEKIKALITGEREQRGINCY